MDFIKADIESKKRQLSSINSSSSSDAPPAKYMKRSDLERHRLEAAQLAASAKQTSLLKAATKVAEKEEESGATLLLKKEGEEEAVGVGAAVDTSSKPEAFNVTNEEAIRRLRGKGQPIRLFGETDKDRRLRLRALQLIEERTEGQRNDFMRAMEGMEKGMDLEGIVQKGKEKEDKKKGKELAAALVASEKEDSEGPLTDDGTKVKEKKPKDEDVLVDVALVKTNPHKIYPQIYHALKRVLKEWEQSLDERPESIRRSTQGKIAAATQQTSADYLKPLFKSLRNRSLAPDVLQAIAEITYNMQIREYLKANDAYLTLSIGNAPWPIGVTMVGIHERSGREKIHSNNVAHVLNDETSRKYIQSLKRLLTFAQTVRPPADVSQKMG